MNNNYKNRLAEIFVRLAGFSLRKPKYFHLEYGPDHAKVFQCVCYYIRNGIPRTTRGEGTTKLNAEQNAAKLMLDILQQTHSHPNATNFVPDFPILKEDKLTSVKAKIRSNRHQFDRYCLYGNALLRFFIAEYLFKNFSFPEGEMTRIVSEAVKEDTRANIAECLELQDCVSTVETRRTLAEAYNAALGAYAEESACKDFVLSHYKSFIDMAVVSLTRDSIDGIASGISSTSIETECDNFISKLFELGQRGVISGGELVRPAFRTVSQCGPAHAPTFGVECSFFGHATAGTGSTKKAAEQAAAASMWRELQRSNDLPVRQLFRSQTPSHQQFSVKQFQKDELEEWKERFWPFNIPSLDEIHLAFTHPSRHPVQNYQRLEFLGDAIIRKVLLSHVLTSYPDESNKEVLSRGIDALVNATRQAAIARRLHLDKFLYTQTAVTDDMLSDVFEAMTAALYVNSVASGAKEKAFFTQQLLQWHDEEIVEVFGHIRRTNTTTARNL